jgi:hypothetical protein
MAGSDTFGLEVFDDATGRYVRVPDPSAKPLAVRKPSAKEVQKRRFDAKIAERQRNNAGATKNLSALGSGVASIPGRVVDYFKTSTPSSVARDVKGIATSTYDAAVENPNAFIEDAILSPLAAARDFGDVRATARKLRAQGRTDEAEAMEAMAGTAVLSAIPIIGRPAGAVTRKAIKAANKAPTPKAKKPLAAKPKVAAPKPKTSELKVTPKAKANTPPEVRTSGAIIRPDDKFRGEGTPQITVTKPKKPFVIRSTTQSQIDDMVASGLVRPKEGGYGKQQSPQIYFGESDAALPTDVFGKPKPGKFVLVGKSDKLAGKEGPISIDDLEHIWEDVDGEIVDILPDVISRNRDFVPTSDLTVTPKAKAKPVVKGIANPLAVTPPAKAPRKGKYQAVEPVAEPHPELVDVEFPQGAGLGGSFAITNRVPIVGRRPFMAQSNKGYSGLSGSVPANRVTTEVRDFIDLPPEFVTSPEEMAKKFGSGIPLIGDKLRAGTATRQVNDRPQVGETLASGGPDFARYAEALGGEEAWKSSVPVIRALENMQKSGEDLYGKPVAGVYTTMGATGLDQSTAMMDLLGRQLAAGGVSKNNLLSFDESVKNILGEEAAKNFTGFAVDPMAAAAQLNDISKVKMPQRTAVQKLLDKASALDQGFPDIGSNRVALTVPELLYAPEGTSGSAITGLTPSGAPRNTTPVNHPNYPKELGGTYEGRTEFGLPRELMFRDYFKAMETLADKGYTPVQIQAYLFQRTPKEVKDAFGSDPRVQAFDQQWVDETSKYIEDIRKYGEEPYAEGGLAVRRRPTPLAVRRSPPRRKSRKA